MRTRTTCQRLSIAATAWSIVVLLRANGSDYSNRRDIAASGCPQARHDRDGLIRTARRGWPTLTACGTAEGPHRRWVGPVGRPKVIALFDWVAIPFAPNANGVHVQMHGDRLRHETKRGCSVNVRTTQRLGGFERCLYISILPVDIDTGRIRIDVALGVSRARRGVCGVCSFRVVRTNPPLHPQFHLSAQSGFF